MSRILEQTHVVIDLETYGTRPGSVILQIGATAFNLNEPLDLYCNNNFRATIALDDSVGFGFTTDEDTINWWKDQPDSARSNVLDFGISVSQALMDFEYYYTQLSRYSLKGINIWGNSNDFDLGLLKAYYHHFEEKTPWSFRDERDFRTMKEVFRDEYEEAKKLIGPNLQPHDAYADSCWEAKILQRMLLALTGSVV